MSSRALRKAQREREEQERLQALEQEAADLSAESDAPEPSTKKSAFAMLNFEDDEEEQADEDEPDFGVADGAHIPDDSPAPSPAAKPVPKKKKKKKNKQVKDVQEEPADDVDEIDRALRELSANGNAATSGATLAKADDLIDETCKLLAVDSNHLHAQNEMRRLFGRAALAQDDDDEHAGAQNNVGGNRRQQRRMQQVGLAQALRGQGGAGGRSGGLASIAMRKNLFIQGKESWPIASGGGLAMEIQEKQADGTWLYRFVHNRVYQDVQAQFGMAVETMDPNQLVALLQHNPYHISTLLQVSEIAKQERDNATSGDLLERALFSFGRSLHSTFAKSLGEGKARLDFRRMENREIWLAAWRYMQNLTMRATWRTVYEWAKLLLALAPEDDPYALWLVLDQYAMRSRQDLDFLNLSRNSRFREVHHDMPNIQLSQGLAEFRAGNKSKGRQALYTAIGRFPWVVARLMQELQITPPPGIWGKEPRTEKEKLYTELYATRAKDLWNTPEMTELLVEVASAVPPETPPSPVDDSPISVSEARHVLLSDTPALIALIPRRLTALLHSSSDPLPPADAYPSYLAGMPQAPRRRAAAASPAENLVELQGLYGFFRSLFPWFRPADEEGAAERPEFNAEQVDRLIRESGVPDEVIAERTARMMELQDLLAPELAASQRGHGRDEGGEDGEGEWDEGDRRARVEDVSDEDD